MGAIDRLKRILDADGGDQGDYECRRCGVRFQVRYFTCPSCGSYSVERTEWEGAFRSENGRPRE